MYKSQRGLVPGVVRLLGLILLFCMFILDIQVLITGGNNSRGFSVSSMLLGLLSITVPLLFLAGMFLCMFPDIRLLPEGIKYSCLFTTGLIKWSEVEDLVKLKHGTVVVVIKPVKHLQFNRFCYQSFYGLLVGHEHPVIFLLPGLAQRDTILSEILKNSEVKRIKDKDDPYA